MLDEHPLLWPITIFVGVLMVGLVLDWLDRKAERIRPGYPIMALRRWGLFKNEAKFDKTTGLMFSYYMLIIRIPSYAWSYRINDDSMGWMQRAIVWCSRDPNPGVSRGPKAGLSIQEIMP